MHLRLHKNATTTLRIRAEIQASTEPMIDPASRFGVSVSTIARWKKRTTVEDASHTPHRLHTTLTPPQEAVVLALRTTLNLSLDDLLAVVRVHPCTACSSAKWCRDALQRMWNALRSGSTPIARTLQRSPIMGARSVYVPEKEVQRRVQA